MVSHGPGFNPLEWRVDEQKSLSSQIILLLEKPGTAVEVGGVLIPMIGFIGLGMGSAALYLLRLALRSPDVCWDRKNNPEPWNRLSPNDQYKFLAVSTDYKKLKKDRPDF